jgi:hypothetical protein
MPASRNRRPGLGSLMLRAAWRVRIELVFALILFFGAGFGIGWLNGHTQVAPASPPAAPASSPTPIEKIVEKTRLISSPVCGPTGMTKDDLRLACSQGWISVDEARLLGLNAKAGAFGCELSEDDARALKADEDAAVVTHAASGSRLCAPSAISADAIRLACKKGDIHFAFARQFGIDAHSASAYFHSGCELSPIELQTLERDEAAVVKSAR